MLLTNQADRFLQVAVIISMRVVKFWIWMFYYFQFLDNPLLTLMLPFYLCLSNAHTYTRIHSIHLLLFLNINVDTICLQCAY